jgi:hypothetical protein
MKNNIFLSYSMHDSKWARDLATVLKKEGLHVWSDAEISPGENWADEIGRALSDANAMVVLISPDAVGSRWVQKEIDFALSQQRFKNRLIPVVVRPTKGIPWILEKQQPIIVAPRKRTAAFRQVADRLLTTVG